MRKKNKKWFLFYILLGLTLFVDVFLLLWEKIKGHNIFPGS